MKTYPFKFLDAYDKADKNIFFGREEEIDELYRLVFQTNLLLVYGASGTGKTSLIRCGLANRFKPSQWLDLVVRRGSDINESLLETIRKRQPQPQLSSLITASEGNSWFTVVAEQDQETKTGDLESGQIQADDTVAEALQKLYLATFTPIYLIFDQFEELYTLGHPEEQQQFTQTIRELVHLPLPVRIIIVMREEYLARLYDLERAVPQLRNKKLRIGAMDLPLVKQVILSATSDNPKSNIELEPGREEEIAEVIVEKIREGDVHVKLPYLQLFMDRLYEKATGEATDRTKEANFSLELVQGMGNISTVLAEFLNQQSELIYGKLTSRYPGLPKDIVWQILSPFATMEGTKVPIKREDLYQIGSAFKLPDPGQADELINTAVAELENSRILRYRKEEQTYEVAHDTLALQIANKRSEEEKAYLKARRMVTEAFASYQDTKTLFSREQLAFIRPYEKRLVVDLEPEQKKFISRSKNKRRRQRITLWIGVVAAFLAAIQVILLIVNENINAKLRLKQIEEANLKAELALDLSARNQSIREKLISRVLVTDSALVAALNLRIGSYDQGIPVNEVEDYLNRWHSNLYSTPESIKKSKIRQNLEWIPVEPIKIDQYAVLYLQIFLSDAGLLQPEGITGIFGYETLSAVRQFQEENFTEGSHIIPNGLVGESTWDLIQQWKQGNRKADYNSFSTKVPTEEHRNWMNFLKTVKKHYVESPSLAYVKINQMEITGDTRKVADWTTEAGDIHLIAVRRKEDISGINRPNDDLFILLINGMAFKFWGSTDPAQSPNYRQDEAFLAEGQHQYRFDWHLKSRANLYRGLVPSKQGVLVFRDDLRTNDNKLTEADIERGVDPTLNPTINIHWTGIGDGNRTTWSNGVLVIAGKSYIDHHNKLVDCSEYAAVGTNSMRSNKIDYINETQGAYNSFLDLITILSLESNPTVFVTLIRDDDLDLDPELKEEFRGYLEQLGINE